MTQAARIGIVTVSDRASRGEYEDRGGPAIAAYLEEVLTSTFETVPRVIPDEQETIESTLSERCDEEGCCLVGTTGGTGPARRDVTVEATLAVVEKPMPPASSDSANSLRIASSSSGVASLPTARSPITTRRMAL